jgi:hypothetical protein
LGRKDFFDLFKLHFYQKDNYFELEDYWFIIKIDIRSITYFSGLVL